MKKILFFCILMGLYYIPVSGDSLKGGYPVCVTKKSYQEFMSAYMNGNEREGRYLLENGCFLLPGGLKITVLDRSAWGANAKVRVFIGDEAMVMWTHYKNIQYKK